MPRDRRAAKRQDIAYVDAWEDNTLTGYASQRDRRNAALIRERQAQGVPVTPQQIAFAGRVEAILAKEAQP